MRGYGEVGCFGTTPARPAFEVQPDDPFIFNAVALLLVLVPWVASWLPARRAAKVDPMVVLRCE